MFLSDQLGTPSGKERLPKKFRLGGGGGGRGGGGYTGNGHRALDPERKFHLDELGWRVGLWYLPKVGR